MAQQRMEAGAWIPKSTIECVSMHREEPGHLFQTDVVRAGTRDQSSAQKMPNPLGKRHAGQGFERLQVFDCLREGKGIRAPERSGQIGRGEDNGGVRGAESQADPEMCLVWHRLCGSIAGQADLARLPRRTDQCLHEVPHDRHGAR
nr:hypothetical protein [Thiocapsa rosea]